jgi:hypothetical protein
MSTIRVAFAPATPYSDSIARPHCSKCGKETTLVGIEEEHPGFELHTFQCPNCQHFETAIAKAA